MYSHFKGESGKRPWVCCQLGAREHYALPRMLMAEGLLELMITDAWISHDSLLGRLPIPRIKSLQGRYHSDLISANVVDFTTSLLVFELAQSVRRASRWQLIVARNSWFQDKSVVALARLAPHLERFGERPVLFSYSYSSFKIIRFAKQRGWEVILGQIDGGREDEKLITAAHRRFFGTAPEIQTAPEEYWAAWRKECSLADHIIVNSEWSCKLLLKEGVKAQKLRIIPVAYEAEYEARKFQRIYPEIFTIDRPLRALFLGNFNFRKGAVAVLEAMSLLQDEPVEFWIVGHVGIEVPLTLRNSSKARWVGPVTRESTSKYYREADLFLFPTLSDGFGMTQVEAQGWKLPVIATPFCATIVTHSRNGLLIPRSEGALIAEAMYSLLHEPSRLQKMSAEAAVVNELLYNPTRVGTCISKLISEM